LQCGSAKRRWHRRTRDSRIGASPTVTVEPDFGVTSRAHRWLLSLMFSGTLPAITFLKPAKGA